MFNDYSAIGSSFDSSDPVRRAVAESRPAAAPLIKQGERDLPEGWHQLTIEDFMDVNFDG